MSEKEQQSVEREDDMSLDISTEFESGEESINTSDHIHNCILELRLVSSNIQNLDTIFNQAPGCRFRFQVIQYSPAGKPWRHLIRGLFPQPEVREKVLQSLAGISGKRFNPFRHGGMDLEFRGQAHCEAVLGCLFSLTKRGEDHSWVVLISAIFPGQQLSRAGFHNPFSKRSAPVTVFSRPPRGAVPCVRLPEQPLHHLPVRAPNRIAELCSPQTPH